MFLGVDTTENRERVVEGRGFFPHILIYFECQKNIILTYHLPSHGIFYLLQEIKDNLEYQVYQNV